MASFGDLGECFVDIYARRPSGPLGRAIYRAPKGHEPSFFAAVTEWLGPLGGERCLEVACGGGVLLERALAGGGEHVAGLDHSLDMLALSIARNAAALAEERLTLKLGDAATIPWPAATFSAAFSANAFFFFEHPRAVLTDIARVLKPGGRLVIATLGAPLPRPSLKTWWMLPPLGSAMRAYTDAEMEEMYALAGFVDITVDSSSGRQLSRGFLSAT
jgi:ubiquinone/menaquinone biosynthesis C-methylase UbiE